jgi:hypothetical protein
LPGGTSFDLDARRYEVLQPTPESKQTAEAHPQQLAKEKGSDLETGLTSAQAAERLAKDGKNELDKEPPEPMWKCIYLFLTAVHTRYSLCAD